MKTLAKIILPLTFLTFSLLPKNSAESNTIPKNHFENYLLQTINNSFKHLKKIKYKKEYISGEEKKDYWQNPQETIKKGSGDCEDKAILEQYLLDTARINSKLLYCHLTDSSEREHICLVIDNLLLETSSKGKIINADTLNRTKNYVSIHKSKYLPKKINEYRSRNGARLNFKNYD